MGHFNQVFYLAAAGAIPVLWLTAGFASNAIGNLLRLLRGAELAALMSQPGIRVIERSLAQRPIRTPIGSLTVGQRLFRTIDARVTQPAITWLFVAALVVAGLLGEIISFVALYREAAPSWNGVAVLVCICVLTALCGVVLFVSVVKAGLAEAGEPGPGGPGGPGPEGTPRTGASPPGRAPDRPDPERAAQAGEPK